MQVSRYVLSKNTLEMELGHEISNTPVSTQKILECKKSAKNIKIWRIYKQFTSLALKKP